MSGIVINEDLTPIDTDPPKKMLFKILVST